ncbi:xylan 1,4-beta-xylosidase [Paraliobacillus ryukyuensis]|uniref:Beta-glucosidase n=1 Tax=Paraliobacillus ryukyuensis TaxID=200904 RepID=A0A366EEF5_9BACI|nr:glycoside hydrolase family 3 protein [Paraliobacillus ryukyuensis]RBP00772.1 beta-glucosidase [Paraliobacillus ryukyuensis]
MDYTFQNQALPLTERVDDLIKRLTLQEKISLLSTSQSAIQRLGIKAYEIGGEAAHGVVDRKGGKTTVFPQPIGLSSTWNPSLIQEVGSVIGDEARGFYDKYQQRTGLTLWAPTIDMERDPRWGRTEEAYGEDPYLTGRLSTALIKGMQGNDPFYVKMVPAPKHFFSNNNEHGRGHMSNSIDPRNRYEYYLKAFEPAFTEANALSMMTAYNGVNGIPAMQLKELQQVVRDQWKMDGFIVSDGGALSLNVEEYGYYSTYAESLADALKKGVDCFVDEKDKVEKTAQQALDQNLISEADLTIAIRNILKVRFRLGHFDADSNHHPYAKITKDVLANEKHAALARKVTEESIVLLKNHEELLPLNEKKLKKIAVIGPTANCVFRDWYTGHPPYVCTPYQGIKNRGPSADVQYVSGHDTIALKHQQSNLYVTRATNSKVYVNAKKINKDAQWIDEDWGWNWHLVKSALDNKYLTLPEDDLKLQATKAEVFDWFVREKIGFHSNLNDPTQYHLSSWQEEPLEVANDATIQTGKQADSFEKTIIYSGIEQAVEQAKASDVAIVCVGNHPMINGRETEDRPGLGLPLHQQKLIQAVHQANPRTIVVVIGSYPFSLNWEQEHIPAILYSAHGSQELGNALSSVMFGDVSPSGKLSMTWYKHAKELPSIFDYDIIKGNRTYMFAENNILYPFGYGLHYGKVTYQQANIVEVTNNQLTIAVTVTNQSKQAFQEVIQIYAQFLQATLKRPNRLLVAFQKVPLAPNEQKTIRLVVKKANLQYYDVAQESYRLDTGSCCFHIGSSSQATNIITEPIILTTDKQPPRSLEQPTKAENYNDYAYVKIGKGEHEENAVMSQKEGWICFKNVMFKEAQQLHYRVTTDGARGEVQCFLDQRRGKPVTRQTIEVDYPQQWKTQVMTIPTDKAVHDLYLVFKGPVHVTTVQLVEGGD